MRRTEHREDGFTLVELLAAMALMGILMAMVVGPWSSWQAGRSHQDAAREAVAALRNAQVSAVAESVRYRVGFSADGRTLTVYRSPVSSAEIPRKTITTPSASVLFSAPAFTTTSGSGSSAYFYPRGSASAGSVAVSRAGHTTYLIDVEGLTGRVSLDH